MSLLSLMSLCRIGDKLIREDSRDPRTVPDNPCPATECGCDGDTRKQMTVHELNG